MKRLATVAFTIFILLLGSETKAQEDSTPFTLCDSAFMVKVQLLIEQNFESKKEARKYFLEFSNAWKSDFFSQEMRFDICEISGILLINKKAPFELLKLYFDVLISFSKKSYHRTNYQIFNYLLRLYVDREKSLTFIGNYIQSVLRLIEGNFLFDTPHTQWKASTGNFIFEINDQNYLEISFPECNLIGYAQNDSIVILQTEGSYDLKSNVFRGTKGKVTWERAGFSPDSVYAVFDHYSFEVTRCLLIVDTVRFYNLTYFEDPMEGRLRLQAENIATPQAARFPKFESFQNKFTLSDLYPRVDYTGGYVQHGSRFIGFGTKEDPAILNFWRESFEVINGDTIKTMKVALRILSDEYVFTKSKVTSDNAIISIYLDQDSIFHPGLKMQYLVAPHELQLIQDNDLINMSRSPYLNSYHKIEFRSELLTWKLDEHDIFFTRMLGTESSKAIFESYDYFAADRFFKLQGIDHEHPLFKIREFVQRRGNETFTAKELGAFMQYSESKMRQLLLLLSFEGYVYYDRETYSATVLPKLYDYCLAALNQKDFDVIAIESEKSKREPNARLNLRNFDLNIFGITSFPFSKINRVIAFPSGGVITIQKDRTILFAGTLRAGLYSFKGKRFLFNYQDFKINLEEVEQMLLDVVTGLSPTGEYIVKQVNNKIQDVKGYILIDNPKNKSGRYTISRFPVFQSTQNSYVYYDHLYNGEYKRDKVYFEIDPFRLDSINNPAATKIKLHGKFVSANIFPEFRQQLTVQKDLSLGFSHQLPESGYNTYGGKGVSRGIIEVANDGIRMRGEQDFLRTTTWSNNFLYFPDSMQTLSQRFLNRSSSEPSLPLMDGKNISVSWLPYQDKLIGQTTSDPIAMFNNQASLSGIFLIVPEEITGSGQMAIERSKLISDDLKFTEHTISSNLAEWILSTKDKSSMAFESTSLKAFIDFQTRKGTFTAVDPNNVMNFPVNQYMTYADQVLWDIDKDNLAISAQTVHSFVDLQHRVEQTATTTNPAGALFVSTHPQQENLNFISPEATVNVSNNTITAKKVGFIHIADATIFPSDSIITIEAGARHRTLSGARVIANRINKYYTIYDATISISSRLLYSGSGFIDYVDIENKRQTIRLDVISVNQTTGTTFASGQIAEDKDFSLSPAFRYKGNVKLFADNPFLFFEGMTKMTLLPSIYPAQWIKFKSEIDPSKVLIPVDSLNLNDRNRALVHSLITQLDSVQTYVSFFNEPLRPNYHPYSHVPGYLTYDFSAKKYEVATLEKLNDRNLVRDIMSLNTEKADFYNEGNLKIVRDLGLVDLRTYGRINYFHERKELLVDLFMAFDFYFHEPTLQHMADTINQLENLSPIQINSFNYTNGMKTLIGDTAFVKLTEQMQLFGKPKEIPEGYKKTIVLTNVNLRWDAEDNAFKSFGNIGVGNILDQPINKFMKGAIEIRYIKQKPEVMIYLEPTSSLWFFFVYRQNSMLAVSSDPKFNEKLEKIKLKHRIIEKGKQKYTYYLTYPRIKDETLFYFEGGKKDDPKQKRQPRR